MFFLPLSLQHSSQEQALNTEFNDMKSPGPSETMGLGRQGQWWPGKVWVAEWVEVGVDGGCSSLD